MKKFFILITLLLSASVMSAGIYEIHLITKPRKGADRTELPAEPQANYDDENNTVEVAIEAEQLFEMKVIDIDGTIVFSCPVLMVDGTPTNYQLPERPAGIYTLKVESPEVSYEGTLVIE